MCTMLETVNEVAVAGEPCDSRALSHACFACSPSRQSAVSEATKNKNTASGSFAKLRELILIEFF